MFPRNRILQSLARNVTYSFPRSPSYSGCRVGRAFSMYNPIKLDDIDPDKIFDEIDISKSGSISREEFKAAMGRLRYKDLMKIHEAAVANAKVVDSKLNKLEEIENDMEDLKRIERHKHDIYNNIGMTTAADLDELFDEAKLTRRRVRNTVTELKGQLSRTRDAYHNIGMTTAADLESFFPRNEDKTVT